jgi:hypothetical protein
MGFLTLKAPEIEPVTVAQLMAYGHLDPNEDQSFLSMLISAARAWAEEFTQRAFIFQTKRLLLDFFPGSVNPALVSESTVTPYVWGPNSAMIGIQYAIRPGWPIVREVFGITYQDPNGQSITMEPGRDFIADVDSQPARLTPLPGNYWPVAYVIANAIQIDYVTGFGGPIPVSIQQGSKAIESTFNFLPRDVGSPISIPDADVGGKTPLVTKIASVDTAGNATVELAAGADVVNGTTNFGTIPALIQQAILALAVSWYEKRIPDSSDIPTGVKALLWPFRDLRL